MKFICSTLLMLWLLTISVLPVLAEEDVPLIFLSNSDSEVEIEIGKYLNSRGWSPIIKRKKKNFDDAYLVYHFHNKDLDENTTITIDTTTYRTQTETGEILTKRIKFFAYQRDAKARVAKKNFPKVLQWVNERAKRNWAPGRCYIDGDDDLVVDSLILLNKNAPIHAYQIYEHLKFFESTTQKFYSEARKAGLFSK